jgi:hypothetical protein
MVHTVARVLRRERRLTGKPLDGAHPLKVDLDWYFHRGCPFPTTLAERMPDEGRSRYVVIHAVIMARGRALRYPFWGTLRTRWVRCLPS